MNPINKQAWKIAIYFIFFELLFWISGIDFIYAIQYMIEEGKPLIAPEDSSGVFHSYIGLAISFLFLLSSAWCMKQFVKNLISEIRANGKGT